MPHKAAVWCAVFSPDGRQIATGSADNTARVWDAITGQPLTPPLSHNDDVWSVSFGREGTTLFTASGDGLIRRWRWLPRNSITAATDVHSSTRQFVFASREAGLHIALANGTPLVWDGTSTNRPQPALSNAAAFRVSCFSLDATRLLGVDTDDFVQIWSIPGSRLLARWRHIGPRFVSARFSPDASLLVAISEVGDALVLDPGTGRLLRRFSCSGGFRNAGLSADNLWLTTVAEDSKPQLWSLADGRPLLGGDFTGHMKFLPVFSPDGRHVILGSWPDESSQSVQVWDLATWQPITPDLRHSHYIHAAVFSPDGRRVATAGGDFLAKIWDADDGHMLTPPLVHDGEVVSLAISPDGNLLATSTASGNVRVWDAHSGEPITPNLVQPQPVSRLQFSADGLWLAIGGAQGHVGLWTTRSDDLPPVVLSDFATLIAGSRLSESGLLLPLNAGELSALAASLRARTPKLFE
jgi:WD40 repeat protein